MGARSALPLAAALWFGILASRPLGERAILPLVLGTIAVATVAVRAPRRTAAVGLTLAALLAGAARGAGERAALERIRAGLTPNRLVRVAGVAVEPPDLAGDPVTVVLSTRRAPGALAAGSRLRLRLPAGTRVEWGDELECLARLDPIGPARNPGGFDPRLWAEARGVAASGRAFAAVASPPRGALRLARATLARWRRGIEARLARGLSPTALELTLPLVTGDRSTLSPLLGAELRSAGLVHLLALSGLHVSALAAVARSLAATAGGGVGARAAAGAAAALFYAGLAGPVPSLMRAAVGECWLAGARLARRAADPVQGLGVTALALLLVAPGWAWDLGFQLSCAASLGLATLASPLAAAAGGRARRWVSPLAVTAAAQIAAAPILIAATHGLSWPGFAANLVAVPITGLLLAAAWLAVLADVALPGAGHFGFSACEALARALAAVTGCAAGWPQALIATGHEPGIPWLAGLGAALLVIAACVPRDLESRRIGPGPLAAAALGLGGFCSALAVALAITAREPHPAPGRAWIVALDVGQGDAIALGLPDGWWLVDAGPRTPRLDAGESVVRPFLRWAAVRRLAVLAVTHDDGDHTGGAPAVMRAMPVGVLLGPPALPGVPGPLARFADPSLGALARGPRRARARGDTLRESPGVRVLWPPSPRAPADSLALAIATRSDNAAGLVLEVEAGPTRVLLTADVDSVVEAALDVPPPVALLKAGHHGSASSSGAGFLARIEARQGWISAGAHNVYGHPAPAALARLAAAGVRLRRTDLEGALWYEAGDDGVRVLDWRGSDPCRSRDRDSTSTAARPVPAHAPREP